MVTFVELFRALIEHVPCCSCCRSDQGYTEAVKNALVAANLSPDQASQLMGIADDVFKPVLAGIQQSRNAD